MNKEFIKEQVQEILDKNYCTFQGGNEADIHSCYDIAELFEQQFLEKEKEIANLKLQVDSLVHCITHLEKDKIPIVINSKHCHCREPKIYRKWGEVGCDKCGKLINPNQSLC